MLHQAASMTEGGKLNQTSTKSPIRFRQKAQLDFDKKHNQTLTKKAQLRVEEKKIKKSDITEQCTCANTALKNPPAKRLERGSTDASATVP